MTDTTARLQELHDIIDRAEAEIQAIHAGPMQKAIDAYRSRTKTDDSLFEIEAGLRVAYPHLKASMEAKSDWIDWRGGPRPVPGDTEVEVICRYGARQIGRADAFLWAHIYDRIDSGYYVTGHHHADIISYRIV